MNSTKTKRQATPAEVVTNDRKSSTFDRFKWTPENISLDATVSARQLCRLVDHVIVAPGESLSMAERGLM